MIAATCFIVVAGIANLGQAQTFKIDNDHTSLVFAVSHSGLSYTYGRFNQCSGKISIGKSTDEQTFVFTVDSASIDTNNRLRDDHLKGPDFFDVQAFPTIEFRSVRLTQDGDKYTAVGVLALHGVKKDLTIELTKIGTGKGPRGKTRAGFFSKFAIKRSDFGIRSLPSIIGNQIALTLSFEGILTETEPKSLSPNTSPKTSRNLNTKSQKTVANPVGVEKQYRILEP